MPTDDPKLRDRANELYAAWTLAEEAGRGDAPTLTFADLIAFLTGTRTLTAGQQGLLFSNRRLRADFQSLKEDMAVHRAAAGQAIFHMPAVAAAASEEQIDDRAFAGATVRIRVTGRQAYVVVTLLDTQEHPSALLIESPLGELARGTLPVPDENGRIMLIKDLGNADDALFVRLLRDPKSSGVFLQ